MNLDENPGSLPSADIHHNLTPADVYLVRGPAILAERARIKRHTIQNRRLLHRKLAA